MPGTSPPRLQTVVVTLTTGADLKGVLRELAADAMILTNAFVAGSMANSDRIVWKALPGEVVIPIDRVEYWQRALPSELLAQLEES